MWLAFSLWLGCRLATPVEGCEAQPETCLACEADAECAWQGNPCVETVICGHVDAGYAFVQIGCSEAIEYRWPEEEACGCVEGECRIRE